MSKRNYFLQGGEIKGREKMRYLVSNAWQMLYIGRENRGKIKSILMRGGAAKF
jgi:hypothetical protein